jgi:hypothetical protein
LDEDLPAFGDDLLFFVFFLVPDDFPFFVFRDFPALDGDAGDLLLDLDEDFPALDGDAGDLLLDLDEDLPAFGDALLFFVFFLVPDDFPFFVFRDFPALDGDAGDLLLDLDEDFPALDGDAADLLLDLDEDFPALDQIPDEGLRSGGSGEEGFTSCVCQDIGACGERLSACGERLGACGKSIGVRDEGLSARDEGFGTNWKGIIGFTGCMMVGADCPLAVIELGSINKRHMR